MSVTFSVVPCDRHCSTFVAHVCVRKSLEYLINSRIIDRIQIGRTIQGGAFDLLNPVLALLTPQHTRNEARAQRTNLQEPFTLLQIQIDGTSLRPQYESGELTYCQPICECMHM
jgi:hypothetical protein